MDQRTLADKANVSRNVIIAFESGRRTPMANNLAAIRKALENAGAIFEDNGGISPKTQP
jgi:transcriptional regulator with XRE-family HTH domain